MSFLCQIYSEWVETSEALHLEKETNNQLNEYLDQILKVSFNFLKSSNACLYCVSSTASGGILKTSISIFRLDYSFLNRLLIGWQCSQQDTSSHARKFLLNDMNFNLYFLSWISLVIQAPCGALTV